MSNYMIEGNIDFFKELYKSLDEETQDLNKKDDYAMDTDLCLITNQSLENHYVKMNCGHKFNYLPLYKYLINYKQKFNSMESSKQKLDINEIRCPYCRHRQNELLPYYDNIVGVKKINGINNEFVKNVFNVGIKNPSCCYKIYNDSINSVICGKYFTGQLPDKYKEKDEGYFCHSHIRKTIQKIEKDEKEKVKKQIMVEKQKLMEQKNNAKEELKKIKMELNKAKKPSKSYLNKKKLMQNPNPNNTEENIILENINIESNTTLMFCQSIIKYGLNKGNHCSFKIHQDGLCKRHYHLFEKKNI